MAVSNIMCCAWHSLAKRPVIVDNLGLPKEDQKKIDKIIQALKVFVEGAVNETVERRNFRKRRQHIQESFDDFLDALRDLIKACNYCAADDWVNKALRDQVKSLQDGDTIDELLCQKDLTLDKTIQMCRARKSAKHQRDQINGNSLTISTKSTYKAKQHERHGRPNRRQPRETKLDTRTCTRCGKPPHKNPSQCPAINKFVINPTSLDILHLNVAQNRLELMSCNNHRMMNLNRDNCFQSCV